MRLTSALLCLCFFLASCVGDPKEPASADHPNSTQSVQEQPAVERPTAQVVDPNLEEKLNNLNPNPQNQRRVEIKKVVLTYPIRRDMVDKGQLVYQNKCASCHEVTKERLKAVGFEGLTLRRTPEWIMNMLTWPAFDAGADQARIRQCMVREEGNLLTIEEARDFLEFMRFNAD
jgi:hypothetical protein